MDYRYVLNLFSELKWYQNNIFIAPPGPAQVASNAREKSSILPPSEDKTEV